MSIRRPPSPELLTTRPAVALEPEISHNPDQGPVTGRPPARYTAGVHESIIRNIERGNRPHVAAAMAGIPSSSYYAWMRAGKDGDPFLWKFAEDVEIAMAKAEGRAIGNIAGDDEKGAFEGMNGENAKWWLERTRSDGYSKEAATKVNAMLEEFFKRLESSLPTVITPEMVGKSMFGMVIAAASGQAVVTHKATFQLHGSGEEEDNS